MYRITRRDPVRHPLTPLEMRTFLEAVYEHKENEFSEREEADFVAPPEKRDDEDT